MEKATLPWAYILLDQSVARTAGSPFLSNVETRQEQPLGTASQVSHSVCAEKLNRGVSPQRHAEVLAHHWGWEAAHLLFLKPLCIESVE